MMSTFLITFAVFGLVVLAMAIGVIAGRKADRRQLWGSRCSRTRMRRRLRQTLPKRLARMQAAAEAKE